MSEQQEMMRLSKRMAFVLRHNPASAGLTLDEHGWVSLLRLSEALSVSQEQLLSVAAQDTKQRYTVTEGRMRAAQGHSVEVDLQHRVATPPAALFHGTVASATANIRAQGLLPQSRLAVHLSPNVATATAVSARRGEPVILLVRAWEMLEAGFEFRVSENGVWLVNHVPAKFIDFPE